MDYRFSEFARRLTGPTGTRLLMDDLGEALAGERPLSNLGGGNPAQIPAMQDVFRAALTDFVERGGFDTLSASYDGPQGHQPFLRALAALLRREYGWDVGPANIAMTAGSQSSFFMLFNLFAGRCEDGVTRHVRLPLAPEYIGYADIALHEGAVRAARPTIDFVDEHVFKYRVDFDGFEIDQTTGAVCVSRPTNPTGNVLSGEEIERLARLTRRAGVPLIVDNAYGVPFPNIVFNDARPVFDEHVICCLSLSKLGLPGLRTGIVVADEAVIDAITSMNAILTLATGSLGAALVTPLVESGEVLELGRTVIRPHYEARVRDAVAWCHEALAGLDYFVHKPEGAIFLWLWFRGLPVSAAELYRRLKARGVLVIPGHYFFPGLDEPWDHAHECLRISYAQSPEAVRHGIGVIGEEVRRAWDEAG